MQTRVGVRLGKFSLVRRTLYCRRCNFKRWLSAGQLYVIVEVISAL